MIDFLFIEFYIKKKYNILIQDYFEVTRSSTSLWRANNVIPITRLSQFKDKEGISDIGTLFNSLYEDKTMDIHFMEFYIKKKYDILIHEYFKVTNSSSSLWRVSNELPEFRLLQFKDREGTIDIDTLFKELLNSNVK